MTLSSLRFFRALSHLSLALAMFSIAGGHWALFQSVAYFRMVYTYSSGGTWSSALEKTLSGKYPCALCKKISLEKKKERNNPSAHEMKTKKGDLFLNSFSILTFLNFRKMNYPSFRESQYTHPLLEIPEPPPKA